MQETDVASLYARKLSRWTLIILGLVGALVITVMVSVCIGTADIPLEEVVQILMGGGGHAGHRAIILEVRFPRVLLGAMVGAALALAGAAMQGLFKNPMASPYILGLSSGGAFGASLAIVLGISFATGAFAIPVMAFVFSFITLFIVYNISKVGGRTPVETLLLSGIAVGAFFSALVSFMKYIAGDQLSSIVFWMMGGLWTADWDRVMVIIPFLLVGTVIIFILSRDLNAMMMGEDHAVNLGVNTQTVTKLVLLAASLTTAAAVSVSGIIGFVGLIVPHIMRIMVGPDHRILLPSTLIVGAIFMIMMDTLARTVMGSEELPVGILTAIMGAPFFLYLLRRRKRLTGW
ncbi:MAG: FecCD family ABC transporter permease [Methanomassiliicoccales archaeon]